MGHIVDDGSGIIGTIVERVSRTRKSGATKKRQQDIISKREFDSHFLNESDAVAFVEEAIWNGISQCGHCGSENIYQTKSGRPMRWRCRTCKRYFSVRTGTVLGGTNLKLSDWIFAIRYMLTDRKGIAALHLQKELGIAYSTAWFLQHRIREAMDMTEQVLEGVVQVDEAWIGGKAKNIHASKKKKPGWTGMNNKIPVITAVDQQGRTIIVPLTNTEAKAIQQFIKDHIKPGSTVWTDGAAAYQALTAMGYQHDWVDHTAGEYVNRFGATSNKAENRWSLLKRAYVGTFHYMSWQHLHRYMNELAYRNTAGHGNGLKSVARVLRRMVGRRLTYEQLIENSPPRKKKSTG